MIDRITKDKRAPGLIHLQSIKESHQDKKKERSRSTSKLTSSENFTSQDLSSIPTPELKEKPKLLSSDGFEESSSAQRDNTSDDDKSAKKATLSRKNRIKKLADEKQKMAKRRMDRATSGFDVESINYKSPVKDRLGNIRAMKMQIKPSNKTEKPVN